MINLTREHVLLLIKFARERGERPDLSEADLHSVELVATDLSGANLSRTNLNKAILRKANLSGTILHRAELNKADLRGVDLSCAELEGATLVGANLSGADLSGSFFRWANLCETNLRAANLCNAILVEANLRGANLSKAHLSRTNLDGANLSRSNLSKSSLIRSSLRHTNLSEAILDRADFRKASVGWTKFANIDLSVVKGLETVYHEGPSSIGIETIYRSKGNIPDDFLRGAGVPDTFIAYIASLTGIAIQYYSCFISYSSKNEAFAQRLHADLQQKGVRCWFAPEDMKIGDKIRPRIDESIRIHDKLLLILSEHSIKSSWVEKEVETAFEEEDKREQIILFPVRLDSTVMETDQAWAADIRRSRHIGDFSQWKDHDAYQQAFERLLRNLKAEK